MALDGFTVDVPDTPRNDRTFGRPGGQRAPGLFRSRHCARARSHVLWWWLITPYHRGEVTTAHRLLRGLRLDMPTCCWCRTAIS